VLKGAAGILLSLSVLSLATSAGFAAAQESADGGASGPESCKLSFTVAVAPGQTAKVAVGTPVIVTIQAMTGTPPVPDKDSSDSVALSAPPSEGADITPKEVTLEGGTGTAQITFGTAGGQTIYGAMDTVECTPAQIQVGAPPAASSTSNLPRIIVGYEQSGANSANSAGRLYADSYYGRAISTTGPLARARIFGDANIGSSAQNANSTLGGFATGLSGTASSLKLNQVASVAEFLTGAELSLTPPNGNDNSRLALFGEYGATGSLQTAELTNIYAFPANTTQAYSLLVAAEAANDAKNGVTNPTTTIPTTCVVGSSPKITGVANNCMYIEFVQQQPYFNQEGYVGLKMVTPLTDGTLSNSVPDVISIGFGANNAVYRRMRFKTLRVDGFVPFSVPPSGGNTKSSVPVFYIFGYACLAFDHSVFPNTNNFIPLDASSTVNVGGVPQSPNSGNTYVIYTTPQPEEYYSIGVGVDLKSVWGSVSKIFKSPST
jgi:hypothetical protein